jgi:hypothetical protein
MNRIEVRIRPDNGMAHSQIMARQHITGFNHLTFPLFAGGQLQAQVIFAEVCRGGIAVNIVPSPGAFAAGGETFGENQLEGHGFILVINRLDLSHEAIGSTPRDQPETVAENQA